MTELVSLTQAKQRLRLPLDVDLDDDALYGMLEEAHALVLSVVKTKVTDDATVKAAWVATVDAWTSDTAPRAVKAAILETVADLDADRGDRSNTDPERRHWALSPRAAGFLTMTRAPVLR
jgi:hypothetical protein